MPWLHESKNHDSLLTAIKIKIKIHNSRAQFPTRLIAALYLLVPKLILTANLFIVPFEKVSNLKCSRQFGASDVFDELFNFRNYLFQVYFTLLPHFPGAFVIFRDWLFDAFTQRFNKMVFSVETQRLSNEHWFTSGGEREPPDEFHT